MRQAWRVVVLCIAMVYAPGGGRGPLPVPVAVILVLIAPLLLWFVFRTATEVPRPIVLSCTRERADLIACDPGNVRGPQVVVRSQTGKNAKRCFVLGNDWMHCGGDVDAAAAKVNALAVGTKADVDVTPPKSPAVLFTVAALAVVMFGVGLHRLMKARS